MSLRSALDALDLLSRYTTATGLAAELERRIGLPVETQPVTGDDGGTVFLRVRFEAKQGQSSDQRTVGIVGRLGGVRTETDGPLVSDADGAIAAIGLALEFAYRRAAGEAFGGTIVVSTHIAPKAPTIDHDPVPLMGSPIPMDVANRVEITEAMDLILSVDATKGNKIVNVRGIGFTPPVYDGWILPVPSDLVKIYERVTGRSAVVIPLSTYDITPYGNGLPHMNSIVQPATASRCPVIGVGTLAESAVPGTATGANQMVDISLAIGFCVEVARDYLAGRLTVYDQKALDHAVTTYGSLSQLKQSGTT